MATHSQSKLQAFIQANEGCSDPETVRAVKQAKKTLKISRDEEQE